MNPKHKRAPEQTIKVGFYGCSDTLVRVGVIINRGERAPQHAMVDCPACHLRHGVGNFLWRKAHSADEWELAEVHIGEKAHA